MTVTKGHGAKNMAVLRHIVLSLLPYFCAKLKGFYSLTQNGGISNQ